jgi:hypothetical protein
MKHIKTEYLLRDRHVLWPLVGAPLDSIETSCAISFFIIDISFFEEDRHVLWPLVGAPLDSIETSCVILVAIVLGTPIKALLRLSLGSIKALLY